VHFARAGDKGKWELGVTIMQRSHCFVLMRFGKKPAAAGSLIEFDAVRRFLACTRMAALSLSVDLHRESGERRVAG